MPDIYYLYTYNISKLKPSNRVRLIYVLKGRSDEIGLIRRLKGKFLANACFLVPEKNCTEVEEVMHLWKVHFKRLKIMLID